MRPITVPIIGDKRARMGNDFLIPIEQQKVEILASARLKKESEMKRTYHDARLSGHYRRF